MLSENRADELDPPLDEELNAELELKLELAVLVGISPSSRSPQPSYSPAPVRRAMCDSISLRAVSTFSGRPVTSNTGSLSRDGVTM